MSWYDTGVAVQPPPGMYFELVGRSSIAKTGYMLANNIGIIDAEYTGTIMVALAKIRPDAEEIALPCRLVQLIPRRVHHLEPLEVEELIATSRGQGGFGSSGDVTTQL